MILRVTHSTEKKAMALALKYVSEYGLIEFDGMNCNDYKEDHEVECGGWDGESRRCECGNRRVSWDIEKNPDGSFTVSPLSY